MSILLLGATGQVGRALRTTLAPLGEIVAPARGDSLLCGDLAHPERLGAMVRELSPRIVVNAAAYTAVDHAEVEPELAQCINALAPAALAEAAAQADALLVHYSSDYVFDGSGSRPWREDDPTAPLNAYGRSKWAGEQAVRAAAPNHLIFRTSWVHAPQGSNFARTILDRARRSEKLDIVSDQYGAPTSAALIAEITARAIAARLAPGTYHLAAAGETSWHGYARRLLDGARLRAPDTVWARELRAVPSSAWPTPAQRPLNSRLDTTKLAAALGIDFPPWQDGVDATLDTILGKVPA